MVPIYKLSWIINNKCNLKCVHCYPDSGEEVRGEFTSQDFLTIEKNLESMSFKRVFLSGGEPVLDEHFFEYFRIAKKIGEEVFLCSNGTVLTDELLLKLKKNGLKGIVLSLQTPYNEESVNFYGIPNVPKRVFESIKKIKELGMKLSVEMTILKGNYQNAEELIRLVHSMGVNAVSFKRLMPIGRGIAEEIALRPDENYEALKRIFLFQLENPNVKINVHDPLYGTVLYDFFHKEKNDIATYANVIKSYSCRAGTQWIGINPLGDVSPCPLLLYKDIIIGNIFDRTVKEIVETSQLIHQLRGAESVEKEICRYQAVCLGCRATALVKKGTIYAKDPMCVHEQGCCPISCFNLK